MYLVFYILYLCSYNIINYCKFLYILKYVYILYIHLVYMFIQSSSYLLQNTAISLPGSVHEDPYLQTKDQ